MDPIDLLVRGVVALLAVAGLAAAARARFGLRKEGADGAADIGLD